jgi:hypothetical protein
MARISPEDIHKARLISLEQSGISAPSKKIDLFSSAISKIIPNHDFKIGAFSLVGSFRKQVMFLVVPVLFSATPSWFGVSGKTWFGEAQASITSIPSKNPSSLPSQNVQVQDDEEIDPIILSMPNLSPSETKELNRYIKTLQTDFAQLNWWKNTSSPQKKNSETSQEALLDKSLSLYEFYEKNKKIIDKMARFAGKWTLEGVCWSTILVPWILHTSRDINEAWENIRLLVQINYKHWKNWSIMLENLVAEWVAEKITPYDLITQSMEPWTILTYDGSQSSWPWKLYWHVEMALTESTLDNWHFYFWEENNRAWWSASPRINIEAARKALIDSIDANRAKKALWGLIWAYKMKPGKDVREILEILADTDIASQQKNIQKIAFVNYSQK